MLEHIYLDFWKEVLSNSNLKNPIMKHNERPVVFKMKEFSLKIIEQHLNLVENSRAIINEEIFGGTESFLRDVKNKRVKKRTLLLSKWSRRIYKHYIQEYAGINPGMDTDLICVTRINTLCIDKTDAMELKILLALSQLHSFQVVYGTLESLEDNKQVSHLFYNEDFTFASQKMNNKEFLDFLSDNDVDEVLLYRKGKELVLELMNTFSNHINEAIEQVKKENDHIGFLIARYALKQVLYHLLSIESDIETYVRKLFISESEFDEYQFLINSKELLNDFSFSHWTQYNQLQPLLFSNNSNGIGSIMNNSAHLWSNRGYRKSKVGELNFMFQNEQQTLNNQTILLLAIVLGTALAVEVTNSIYNKLFEMNRADKSVKIEKLRFNLE